jgi:hypothetical protein
VTSVLDGGGPWVYCISGALYHKMGALLPPEGKPPVYAQLYLYDGSEALERRMGNNPGLVREVLQTLQDVLHRHHVYVGIYKQALEIMATLPAERRQVHLQYNAQTDGRRYNLPTADEVAILIPGDGSRATDRRDIILRERLGGLYRINEGHPAYYTLSYPLIFPRGEHGWHNNIPVSRPRPKRDRVSMREYFAFRLFPRHGESDALFRMGKLYQQFVVDTWAATEQDRLHYVAHNQSTLRAELYQGFQDATSAGDHDLANIGRRTILPSTFTAGSRYMRKLYQDSMAIVRAKGTPDLFITMTANPNWPEVAAAMPEGSNEKTRADIVARVFHEKVKHLMKLLRKDQIFGDTVAHVYTIEFQKRGLPHVHLLLFMERNSKPRTPEHVDSFMSAEIPDKDAEPELYNLVSALHPPPFS